MRPKLARMPRRGASETRVSLALAPLRDANRVMHLDPGSPREAGRPGATFWHASGVLVSLWLTVHAAAHDGASLDATTFTSGSHGP